MNQTATRLLVVAGRDSRGRAGIDADREIALALGVRVRLVVTAETIQDERGLVELGARDPEAWLAEALEALVEPPDAIKFGLLPGAEHVRAALKLVRAARAAAGRGTKDARGGEKRGALGAPPVVIDPVLAPSAGGAFLSREDLDVLADLLLPERLVWTPNVPEAAALAGTDPAALAAGEPARVAAGRSLLERGAGGVVLKGGHAPGPEVVDLVLVPGTPPVRIVRPRLPRRLSGTGCRHASALAIGLARGHSLPEAAREAAGHVAARLEARGEPPGVRETPLPSPSAAVSFPAPRRGLPPAPARVPTRL